jgi:mannose-1-phosphate guanylyltransferase / mannose-6-phosphate isomerase
MFLFKPSAYLAELAKFKLQIIQRVQQAFVDSYQDLDFRRLEESAFIASPSDSIDHAVTQSRLV